jgi:hypothetical protein
MTIDVKFCAILTMRYMNKSLMQSCHDYIASHMPPPPKGLIAMRSFHIAPDRGMSLCYFDTNENLNAAFPSMKEFQQSVAANSKRRPMLKKLLHPLNLILVIVKL